MLSGKLKAVLLAGAAVAMLAGCNPSGGPGEAGTPAAERAANEFMARNAREDGVETLPSGVQYRVDHAGSPTAARPDSNDLVRVHYEGRLLDGTVFDSSYERGVPAAMALDRLIPAWQEAIPQMRIGDEWTLWVPPSEGYGAEGSPPQIPPYSVLVFRIELLDVAPVPGGEAGVERG
jgi:FKBP-type peptidyl-prolyl cis-trans isomerase FklB